MYLKNYFLTPFSPEDDSLCWYEENKKERKQHIPVQKFQPHFADWKVDRLRIPGKNEFQQNRTT